VTLQELMELGDWRSDAIVLKYGHLCPDNLAQAANRVTREQQRPTRVGNREIHR
jgi:hypothetical protein